MGKMNTHEVKAIKKMYRKQKHNLDTINKSKELLEESISEQKKIIEELSDKINATVASTRKKYINKPKTRSVKSALNNTKKNIDGLMINLSEHHKIRNVFQLELNNINDLYEEESKKFKEIEKDYNRIVHGIISGKHKKKSSKKSKNSKKKSRKK